MDANIVVFTDFDGTITKGDILDIFVKEFFGDQVRLKLDQDLIYGRLDHDNYITNTFSKVTCTYIDAISLIDRYAAELYRGNIIDSHFNDFYIKCKDKGIPIYIVSAGFKKFICNLLPFVDPNDVFANDVNINEEGRWEPILYGGGLDKSKIVSDIMRRNKNKKSVYIGDGISDFRVAVAGGVDELYVKRDTYLEGYCIENKKEYRGFSDFSEVNIF
jgi:HAD superfamily phosphoserine phosphatase-like hydrolase